MGAATASPLLLTGCSPAKPAASPLKIGQRLRDVADETLAFYAQIGVQYATMPAAFRTEVSEGVVPPPGRAPSGEFRAWDAEALHRIKSHIEAAGLRVELINLGGFHRTLHGRPGFEEETEAVCACIRIAGQLGIPVVEYNFTPLRGSEGYYTVPGRGGSTLRAFDSARVSGLPPLDGVGTHTREQMWERLERFLKTVVPVAEQAGVRLACHPNDPPIAEFRGAAQPVRSLADLKRLAGVLESPSNGITLDTGVMTEMGEDAVEAIRYFGERDRINHVHFRNVRVNRPYSQYVEMFHDEGEADLAACMRAFAETGYQQLLIPDHSPGIAGDVPGMHKGYAHAIGYMAGLRGATLRLSYS